MTKRKAATSTPEGSMSRVQESRDSKKVKQENGVQAQVASSDHDKEQDWLELFDDKANDLNVYRVRQFITRAKCEEDKHGRKPSLFALQKGCLLTGLLNSSCDMLLDRFPFGKAFTCQEVTDFLHNAEKPLDMSTSQWNKDILFIGMPKGSIVALTIPNKIGQVDVAFGVLTDEVVRLGNPKLLDGFPVPPRFDDIDHVVIREVSWMRIAKLRDLPGQEYGSNGAKYVKWLHESSPSFLLELKDEVKAKALQHLQSLEFLQCSTSETVLA